MMSPRRMRTRGLVLGAALATAGAVLAGPALPAFAHNTVVGESPEADSTVESQPGTVALETSDALLDVDGGAAMDVVGPDGLHYATGCPTVTGPVASVPAELGPEGEYTVVWRVVSADGHPISGEFAFDWVPAADEPLAAGSDASPCASTGSGASDDIAADEDAAASSSGSSDLLWIIGAGVVVLGAVAVALMFARRRPAGERTDAEESRAGGSDPGGPAAGGTDSEGPGQGGPDSASGDAERGER